LAYLLKKANSAYSVAGTYVHNEAIRLCQAAVNGGGLPDRDKAIDRVRRKMLDWAGQARTTTVDNATKARPLSIEVYYGEPLMVASATDNAVACMQNLWESEHVEYLAEATPKNIGPGEWATPILVLDEMSAVPIEVKGWRMELWAAPDLVYEGARGEVRLVDWKTGKERATDQAQLDVYALWCMERGTVAPDRAIRASDDYLQTGISRQDIPIADRALDRIEAMVVGLRKHVDKANKPNIEAERWPKLPEGSRECGWCEYRELCGRTR